MHDQMVSHKNKTKLTAEEKRAFLEEIIPVSDDPSKSEELQQKLRDFLLRDTNGGKLYKYRSFDAQGYSLKNLETGTLHCSRPDVFNDPFDCRLGVSFSGAMDAMIDYPKIDSTFTNVFQILLNQKRDGNYGVDERAIILKLRRDPCFVFLQNELIRKKGNGFKQEKAKFIKEILKATLSYFCYVQMGRTPAGLLESVDSIDIDTILRYDHCPTFREYLSSKGFPDNDVDEVKFVEQYFRSLDLHSENKVDNMDEYFSKVEKQFADQITNTLMVGCLAGDHRNRLMWSHYADGHKGFCIEYDCKEYFKTIPMFPVYYTHNRPSVPWKSMVNPNKTNLQLAAIDMFWALLTKDQCWEYENEWRVIIPSHFQADIEMPISAVYLGANISSDNKATILELANKHKITVKQMKTDRGIYELHAEDVLNFEGE